MNRWRIVGPGESAEPHGGEASLVIKGATWLLKVQLGTDTRQYTWLKAADS
jgi:hypothetical protein